MTTSAQPTERGLRLPALEKKDLLVASGLLILGLLVYIRTLAPDVLWGDSGEFQVISATGGLAHATGYPVYLILGKLFTLIPVAGIPYRVNLLSAVMGAIAVAETFLFARGLGARRFYCVLAAGALLLNPLFWWQSDIAEVYSISAAFFLGFLVCLVAWSKTRDSRWLAVGGALGGLCLGLHHTIVLTLPVILLFMGLQRAKKGDWSNAGIGALAGICISVLGYMVLASLDTKTSSIQTVKWSASAYKMQPSDFDSPLTQVKFVFFAKQWAGDLFHTEPSLINRNVARYGNETISDFGWTGTVFAILGVAGMLLTRRRKLAVLLVGSWLILFLFVMTFDAFDLEVDFIPTYVILAALIAVGFQTLQELLLRQDAASRLLRLTTGFIALAAMALGSWSIWSGSWSALSVGRLDFLSGLRRSFPYTVDDPSKAHEYGDDVVGRVEDGSLIVTQWNFLYPCFYAALFDQNKPNIDLVEVAPFGGTGQMSDSLREYIKKSVAVRPVYITVTPRALYESYGFKPIPGRYPLYRLQPR